MTQPTSQSVSKDLLPFILELPRTETLLLFKQVLARALWQSCPGSSPETPVSQTEPCIQSIKGNTSGCVLFGAGPPPVCSFAVRESCTAVTQRQAGTAAADVTGHLLSEVLFPFCNWGKLRDEICNYLISSQR